MPSRSSRSTDPVRLAYARDPVLITRAPSAAATKADAVERLKVLGPPAGPDDVDRRRGGGSGCGLRSRSELRSAATDAPSGVAWSATIDDRERLAGMQLLPRQPVPEVAPDLRGDRVALGRRAPRGPPMEVLLGIRRLARLVDELP